MKPAAFEVRGERIDGGVHALAVSGELDMSTAPELESMLERAVEDAGSSVMLDLSACEFIDSTGIALIVRAWQRLDADGRRLALCCVNRQVRRLLEITGVEDSIPMHEDRGAALAELRG